MLIKFINSRTGGLLSEKMETETSDFIDVNYQTLEQDYSIKITRREK